MRSSDAEQALRQVARRVVCDGLDLTGALRAASLAARRTSDIQALWQALPGAVKAYQELFQSPAYGLRLRRTRMAADEAIERYGQYPLVLLGAAALQLAADNETLDMGIYLDENEALLRSLIDRAASFRVAELRIALRASDRGLRCSTIEHELPSLGLRLICLRPQWQGRPLYLGGLPWPMLSVSR
jgi:hypothetical protein